jgi:hypothetical protein
MAHFAKIVDGVVENVVVVDNEHEADGEAYLNSIGLEGTWIQTSYHANFRKRFACIGDTYDAENDVFVPFRPANAIAFNEEAWGWTVEPPVEN